MDVKKLENDLISNLDNLKELSVIRKRSVRKNNKYSTTEPTANQIIDGLGGNFVVANICDVTACAVSYWRKNGIPKLRLAQLQLILSQK